VVTGGGEEAMVVLAALLCQGGDLALLDSPSYLGAIDVLTAAGAVLGAVPVGSEGVRLDVLYDLARRRPARLLYLIPTFQNPTGVVMPEGARHEVARVATDLQLPVVEGAPPAPLSTGP